MYIQVNTPSLVTIFFRCLFMSNQTTNKLLTIDLVNGLAMKKSHLYNHDELDIDVYIMFPGCNANDMTPSPPKRRFNSLLKNCEQHLQCTRAITPKRLTNGGAHISAAYCA